MSQGVWSIIIFDCKPNNNYEARNGLLYIEDTIIIMNSNKNKTTHSFTSIIITCIVIITIL